MIETTWAKWMVINLLGILLQSIGLVLFVSGFFPVKPALQGISGIESLNFDCLETSQYVIASERAFLEKLEVRPQFNRVVLMVIDGLPAEFLLGKGGLPPSKEYAEAMPFVQELLLRRKAMAFHAKAAPPTVTMPRLKAMTSGAIAGFLDVAFNFNTQAMLDDNLVDQLGRIGWKMAMYGDDTWLRLFPNSFFCQDGVSSFYVKDTIQVDQNVTRHLDEELARHDWDLLILHFLGLDHVGHLGGRTSPLMALKLQEMDNVIKQLYASLIEDRADRETLLVVASDHGMTDSGNHGGASFEEADALALFIRGRAFSDSGYDNEAFQVDLVPTLALLLGVPIPKNSVGVLLIQLFDMLTASEKLRALEVNSWQLMKLLEVRSPKSTCLSSICSGEASDSDLQENKISGEITKFCNLFKVAKRLHGNWRGSLCIVNGSSCTPEDAETVSLAYLSFLHAASNWLAKGTTEKNTLLIYNGGVLMLLSTALFLFVSASINREVCNTSKSKSFKLENWIALAGVCGHALSFNSSSLVEEEQFTMHFLVVTLWCLFLWKVCQKSCFHQQVSCQSYKPLWSMLPTSLRRSMEENGFDGNATTSLRRSMEENGFDARDLVLAQAIAAVLVLVTARILRGWHRSGVNWAHLPDIAKWLEKGDPLTLLAMQVVSLAVVTVICCWIVLEQTPHIPMQRIVAGTFSSVGCLVLWYNLRTWGGVVGLVDHFSIKIAQLVYALLSGTALVVSLFTPFFLATKEHLNMRRFCKIESVQEHQMHLNFIGKVLISCWCLLQLLLQQPVNAIPVLLLLLQLISCLIFFNLSGSTLDSWLKILMLYWMGFSGYFGMGNTNTLATVDVAGAYIGLAQHSIFWSGLLAFVITYAAPLLYMFAVLLLISSPKFDPNVRGIENEKERWLLEAITLPCSIPLVLSSVILLSFTLVMLLMQGHLFIWSVFSPKYIYVCFTVLSTYFGVILHAVLSLYTYVIGCKFSR